MPAGASAAWLFQVRRSAPSTSDQTSIGRDEQGAGIVVFLLEHDAAADQLLGIIDSMARRTPALVEQRLASQCSCTYPELMNVTLSIDEHLVAEARRVAASRGTTLDELIRDYLVALIQVDDMQKVVSQLENLWASGDCRSDSDWSRDEVHERP